MLFWLRREAMAVAVPRQFEIVRVAARDQFDSKIKLATQLEDYTRRMIRENRSSAFQRFLNDRRISLRARTIVSYITVAQNIGTLDDSLKPTGKVTATTPLSGFSNHLKDCLLPYVKKNKFSLDEVREFISSKLSGPHPIPTITPHLLYTEQTPNISEFTFTQCLLMLDELFSDRFRVRSVRTLLHREVLWGAALS